MARNDDTRLGASLRGAFLPTRSNGVGTYQVGMRLRIGSAVGASIVLGSVFVATAAAAHATKPSFGSQNANAIIAQSQAAMSGAGSVRASGTGSVKIAGVGKVTVTETDYSSETSGSQVLKMTSTHLKPGVVLPSASVLDVGGQLFVKANAPFWSGASGLSDAESVAAANRWVQIQSSSSLYATAAEDLTMPTLLTDLFHTSEFQKGSVHTVDGVRSIAITYRNGGDDASHATSYVALGGKHLPVSVDLGGLSFRFSSWGQTEPVTAPPNPVQLSTILPPSESTT
jgi:hypothetical protein